MTFEDNNVRRIFTIIMKFVYFFKSSIILGTSFADSRDIRICRFSIGHRLLFANGTKAIPVDVVLVKSTDLTVKTISYLSQFVVNLLF